MKRKLVTLAGAAVLSLAALAFGGATSAGAASGGGCQLNGTANFSPGLTNTAGAFNYSFSGTLSSCQSTVAGSPASGAVEAGKIVTASTGEQFQEPIPSGSGSCASGTTSGIAIATWADGTQTVISYSTTAVGAAVDLTGTVVPSVTLPAINPQTGQPTSMTVTTTRYAGDSTVSPLTFQADPTACSASAGLASAAIAGLTTLTGN